MSINFPSSPNTNDTFTDTNSVTWKFDGVKWNVETGSTRKAFNGAKAVRTSDFTVGASDTAVIFSSQDYDTGSYYAVSSPTRISISETGYYRLNAQVLAGAGGSGNSYTVKIRKNGTTVLDTAQAAPNQFVVYDTTVELSANDYVEMVVSESTGSGTVKANDTFLEIFQIGLSAGTTQKSFGGARAIVSSAVSLSSSAQAISWSSTEFDQNSDVSGTKFYSAGSPTRLTVNLSGFYRVRTRATGGAGGSSSSYTLLLRKNGTTTLETVSFSPGDTVSVDETYNFSSSDYIELVASDTTSSGSIADTVFLEIIRLGV